METEDLPSWDEDRAREIVGKTVLLGLTFATADGDVIGQVQRHGIVEHAHPDEGIVDPDLTSTWEIRSPREEDDTPDRREARLSEARRFGFPAD